MTVKADSVNHSSNSNSGGGWAKNKFTFLSLIFNGAGMLLLLIPVIGMVAVVTAVAALVTGVLGYRREGKRGLAILGIVLASIGILLVLAFFVLTAVAFIGFGSTDVITVH